MGGKTTDIEKHKREGIGLREMKERREDKGNDAEGWMEEK